MWPGGWWCVMCNTTYDDMSHFTHYMWPVMMICRIINVSRRWATGCDVLHNQYVTQFDNMSHLLWWVQCCSIKHWDIWKFWSEPITYLGCSCLTNEWKCWLGPGLFTTGGAWTAFACPHSCFALPSALLLCMPGDVYEGRCYLGPPAGQTLIQVLAGGECLRGWAYSTHIVHCSWI